MLHYEVEGRELSLIHLGYTSVLMQIHEIVLTSAAPTHMNTRKNYIHRQAKQKAQLNSYENEHKFDDIKKNNIWPPYRIK